MTAHIKILEVRVHAVVVRTEWSVPTVAREKVDTWLSLVTTD